MDRFPQPKLGQVKLETIVSAPFLYGSKPIEAHRSGLQLSHPVEHWSNAARMMVY